MKKEINEILGTENTRVIIEDEGRVRLSFNINTYKLNQFMNTFINCNDYDELQKILIEKGAQRHIESHINPYTL